MTVTFMDSIISSQHRSRHAYPCCQTHSPKGYLPSAEDLEQFRKVQRLAYAAAEAVARELKPGITEKQAARLQEVWLLDHGVTDWFHAPFAWFGDRTAFQGFKVALQFLPTNRRLEENMPFILDNAPVVGGYVADIGYSGVLGENRILDLLLDDLAEHRRLILDLIRQQLPMNQVSQAVDKLTLQQGHAPRHKGIPVRNPRHFASHAAALRAALPEKAQHLVQIRLSGARNARRLALPVARKQAGHPSGRQTRSQTMPPFPAFRPSGRIWGFVALAPNLRSCSLSPKTMPLA